jgi:hypothetical protein
MMSVIMLRFIMLYVIMLSVIILSIVMMGVILLSVTEPFVSTNKIVPKNLVSNSIFDFCFSTLKLIG